VILSLVINVIVKITQKVTLVGLLGRIPPNRVGWCNVPNAKKDI
jgi:hypothetical protein